MAGRGGAARPNGPAAGNKICQFKLVLLGESAVGKSSLVLRFVKGQFHEYQESTIGGERARGAASGRPGARPGVDGRGAACPGRLNPPGAAAPLLLRALGSNPTAAPRARAPRASSENQPAVERASPPGSAPYHPCGLSEDPPMDPG